MDGGLLGGGVVLPSLSGRAIKHLQRSKEMAITLPMNATVRSVIAGPIHLLVSGGAGAFSGVIFLWCIVPVQFFLPPWWVRRSNQYRHARGSGLNTQVINQHL